jgi:RNA ligase (TIGR02306 family)
MTERSLATIEVVTHIRPIPDADQIEVVGIRGWEVVSGKGNFVTGDKCCYFEIDSMLDVKDPRFAFLAPRGVRANTEGKEGHVLKTIRLRGTYSQGLALPLSEFPELVGFPVGSDVTEVLGVIKWEPPVPAALSGVAVGLRPSWVWKTGAERAQNIEHLFPFEGEVICSEKIDGSSASFGLDAEGIFHVCSHNIDLVESEENTFWKIAKSLNIETSLRGWSDKLNLNGTPIVAQGELYGEGINGNRLNLKGHHFGLFNIDIGGIPQPWTLVREFGLPTVPQLTLKAPESLQEALEQVDGMKSALNQDRLAEGVVWRHVDGSPLDIHRNIKVISNKYLTKEK